MPGFVALHSSDTTPVDPALLRRMAARLAHRVASPQRRAPIDLRRTDPIGLAQIGGRGVLVDSTRELTVVADARIDNRAELGRRFGWSPTDVKEATAPQLILEAYAQWGLDAPAALVGDFAFALWDARNRRLVCARDPIGVRPLFYATGSFGLVCASEVKALLAHPDVSQAPNEIRIAKYLAQKMAAPDSTFYRDVRRLRPGHWLVHAEDGELHEQKYWSIENAPILGQQSGGDGRSDEALIEEFADTFREAVRCRIDPERRTGVMLSGGLDSSSVAAVARQVQWAKGHSLPTFSATFPGVPEEERSRIDEKRYVRVLADLPGMEAHYVPVTNTNPLQDLDRVVAHLDHPPVICNAYLYRAMHTSAREAGVSVLLDGAEGDDTISYGQGWLYELAATSQWHQFAAEARAVVERGGGSAESVYWNYGAPAVAPGPNTSWVRATTEAIRAGRAFNLSPLRILWRTGVRPQLPDALVSTWDRLRGAAPACPQPSLVHPDLSDHVRLSEADALDAHSGLPRTDHELHQRTFDQETDGIVLVMEEADHLGAQACIEQRHPFYDTRLVELAVGLPGHLKLYDGWPRYVLRAAMDGILPDEIRWRSDKANLSSNFERNVRRSLPGIQNDLLTNSTLAPFVDRTVLRDALQRSDTVAVWHTLALAQWLDHASHGTNDPSSTGSGRLAANSNHVSVHE